MSESNPTESPESFIQAAVRASWGSDSGDVLADRIYRALVAEPDVCWALMLQAREYETRLMENLP